MIRARLQRAFGSRFLPGLRVAIGAAGLIWIAVVLAVLAWARP